MRADRLAIAGGRRGADLRRRAFLGAAATLAVGGATPWREARAAPIAPMGRNAGMLAERLLQAYPLRQSLAVIGDAFLREASASDVDCPACLPSATRDLLHHLEVRQAELLQMPPAAIRARIRTENARDFALGRIVHVRGWLLGETEARLCAIAALNTA